MKQIFYLFIFDINFYNNNLKKFYREKVNKSFFLIFIWLLSKRLMKKN